MNMVNCCSPALAFLFQEADTGRLAAMKQAAAHPEFVQLEPQTE
jgi:hypothetical protein